MASIAKPVATCTLSKEGTLTVVKISGWRTVSYEFDTSATDARLALRYLIVINGCVENNNGKPHALDGNDRVARASVPPGSKVALILNSDVHPDFRRHPVFSVLVGENDVHVQVTEHKGRRREYPLPAEPFHRPGATAGKLVDHYDADLSGDVWMAVSNCYTEDEADAMLPDDTEAPVRDAVRRIYRGLPSKELVVNFPASGTAYKLQLRVRFDAPDNVLENTVHCPLLTDVLPRTHPRAYAALLTEAHACQVTALRVTSGWRPMLGSIAHRAGLGLDINYAESDTQRVFINRASLTNRNLPRNENVSERERVLYDEYEQAKKDAAACKEKYDFADKSVKVNRDPSQAARFASIFDAAKIKRERADKAADAALDAWNAERNRNEHNLIVTLRGKLGHNQSISQVLDPWYMDFNTHSGKPAMPNEHRNASEKTHNNHLHITVIDPKII